MSTDGGRYVCEVCDWEYDETIGNPESGIAPGTKWEDIPEDWCCQVCGAGKDEFSPVQPDTSPQEEVVADGATGVGDGGFYLGQWERKSDDLESDFRAILHRAISGHEEISAMRTRKCYNLLDDIVFLPGQLARHPIDYRELNPDLGVIIGPQAAKPLLLEKPFYNC